MLMMTQVMNIVDETVKEMHSDANADEHLLNELRKGNGEDKEVRDGSDHIVRDPGQVSKGRGKVEQGLQGFEECSLSE